MSNEEIPAAPEKHKAGTAVTSKFTESDYKAAINPIMKKYPHLTFYGLSCHPYSQADRHRLLDFTNHVPFGIFSEYLKSFIPVWSKAEKLGNLIANCTGITGSEISQGIGYAVVIHHGCSIEFDLMHSGHLVFPPGYKKPKVKTVKCSKCSGTGLIKMQQGFFTIERTCPDCSSATDNTGSNSR